MNATAVNDGSAFASNSLNNKNNFTLLIDAIVKSGYTGRADIDMDVVDSEFINCK